MAIESARRGNSATARRLRYMQASFMALMHRRKLMRSTKGIRPDLAWLDWVRVLHEHQSIRE